MFSSKNKIKDSKPLVYSLPVDIPRTINRSADDYVEIDIKRICASDIKEDEYVNINIESNPRWYDKMGQLPSEDEDEKEQ